MTGERRKPKLQTESDVLQYFNNRPLDDNIRHYLKFHVNRYAFLMSKVDRLDCGRVLDIGPSFQTSWMREWYPDSVVDSLGFDDVRFPRRVQDRHFDFDLNDSVDQAKWPKPHALYDLVVMAEVLEHLYTAARPVLECVGSFLRPGGALILQTPNAVSLGRRTAMARGTKPYGMIREDKKNPGHFCEFTVQELRTAVESAGMWVDEATVTNYFGDRGARKVFYDTLCAVLPGELHDGITLIARK